MAFNTLLRNALQRITSQQINRQWSLSQSICLQPSLAMAAVVPSSNLMSLVSKLCFSTSSVCANVRNHFPRPNERRRVNRHGWNKRMETSAGRRILMRRILKGRHALSH